jgi:GMP synthase-like glutamine amidotransferase
VRPLLEARGVTVECADLYSAEAQADAAGADGLVFMGGPMCANDDLPYLRRELEIIRESAGRGQPMLGICLGAQLIAKALGGRVYRNPTPEIGWFDVELTAAGMADPVFSRAAKRQPVFQLHQDTFELPKGAELLATSSACRHQAFRLGAKVYGVQFHPEVTPEMIEEWMNDPALCGQPAAPIDAGLHATTLADLCEGIVEGWIGR